MDPPGAVYMYEFWLLINFACHLDPSGAVSIVDKFSMFHNYNVAVDHLFVVNSKECWTGRA